MTTLSSVTTIGTSKNRAMVIETLRTPGIYSITNLVSGRVYIGSTVDLRTRLNYHRTSLLGGSCPNKKLQRDFNSLGLSSFLFDVVEFFEGTEDGLAFREILHTVHAHHQPGGCYNQKCTIPRKETIKRRCIICKSPHYAKGYCGYHWQQYRRKRQVVLDVC